MAEPLSAERLAFIEKHSGRLVPVRELIAEVRRLQAQWQQIHDEQGKPLAISAGLWDFAEAECGHHWASARHALTSVIEHVRKLQAELARERQRRFQVRQVTGCSHSTACSIWGDNGLGGTAEGFQEPLPCNCGALINYERQRAEVAEAALRNMLRVIEGDDVPGYIYDEHEAECVSCQVKAPTRAGIVHEADCYQGAIEICRAAMLEAEKHA